MEEELANLALSKMMKIIVQDYSTREMNSDNIAR
jgi:hypothetical protein